MLNESEISIKSHPEYLKLEEEIMLLKEHISKLERLIFGRKSEKRNPLNVHQPTLFALPPSDEIVEEQKIAAHTRKRIKTNKKQPKRLALPAHLPRIEEIIEPEDKPANAKRIGEEITELLGYNPASLFVRRIIRPKYVDLNKEKGHGKNIVFTAPIPSFALPKSKVDASLLAYILICKFIDHLPLYRQIQQYKRQGIEIPSSTMNDWFMNVCNLLIPLYEALKLKLLDTDYLQADETPIKVQIKNKKGKTHQGYHWVYHNVEDKIVCFDYQKSRNRVGPTSFLSQNGKQKYKGTLQTDGYAVYDIYEADNDVELLGCMAHVRRKFFDARKNDQKRADKVLDWIGELYDWERMYKEEAFTSNEIKQHRIKNHLPILDKIENYCQTEINHLIPKSSMAKAMGYAIRQWKKLKRYTQNGKYLIDNNKIENTIRPVALGRKNYLFAGSHLAAQHAAMIYSFVGTCKLLDVEPYAWLKFVLDNINDCPINKIEKLLPHNFVEGV